MLFSSWERSPKLAMQGVSVFGCAVFHSSRPCASSPDLEPCVCFFVLLCNPRWIRGGCKCPSPPVSGRGSKDEEAAHRNCSSKKKDEESRGEEINDSQEAEGYTIRTASRRNKPVYMNGSLSRSEGEGLLSLSPSLSSCCCRVYVVFFLALALPLALTLSLEEKERTHSAKLSPLFLVRSISTLSRMFFFRLLRHLLVSNVRLFDGLLGQGRRRV